MSARAEEAAVEQSLADMKFFTEYEGRLTLGDYMSHLCKARFLGRNVAPLLHHRLLHLPGVGPGPGAHLFGTTSSRTTKFDGLLGATSNGSVLLPEVLLAL